MDTNELKVTDTWGLYQKALDYARMENRFDNINKCINFFNGDQWEGLQVGKNTEPVSLNFIKPIVNYKVGVVTESLRAINFSADNVDNTRHRRRAKKICELLNIRAARQYEQDEMDKKVRKMAKESAITSESVAYVYHDNKENKEITQILSKADIFYADETNEEIQTQPYILLKQRVTVPEAKEIARSYDLSESKIKEIRGDKKHQEEAGTSNHDEFDDKVTIITKFYKEKGTVHFTKSTEFIEICKDEDTGLKLYPLFHYVWESKIGSARGVSEVYPLIHNQIEANKNLMRASITAKNIAYPQKIYLKNKIANPSAINQVGGIIEAKGEMLEDVNKVFAITRPQQMSPDVAQLRQELINTTRELANASNTATGQVNPEDASGKAILAVQRASQQPLNEQVMALNQAIEDYGRILLDHLKTYYEDGLELEEVSTDTLTQEESVKITKISGTELKNLEALVKIDITPKSPYDKYAQELSLENLAQNQNFMNTAWLKDFTSLLDNDSVMPKGKIEDLIKVREENQKKIREIQQKGAIIQEKINQMMQSGQIVPKEMIRYNSNDVNQMINNSGTQASESMV